MRITSAIVGLLVAVAAPSAAVADPLLVGDDVDPGLVDLVHRALDEVGIAPETGAADHIEALRWTEDDRDGASNEVVLAPLEVLDSVREAFYGRDYERVIDTLDVWLDDVESSPRVFARQPGHLEPTLDALLILVRTLDAVEPERADSTLARVRAAMWGVHPSALDVPPSVIERWDALPAPAPCTLEFDGVDPATTVRVDGRNVEGETVVVPCRDVLLEVVGPTGPWREVLRPTRADAVDLVARARLTELAEGRRLDASASPNALAGAAALLGASATWVVRSDADGRVHLERVGPDASVATAPIERPRLREVREAVERLSSESAPQPDATVTTDRWGQPPPSAARRPMRWALGVTTGALVATASGLEVSVAGARRELDACADAPACVVSGDVDAWRDTARARRTAANVTWALAGAAATGWVVSHLTRERADDAHGPVARPGVNGFVVVW